MATTKPRVPVRTESAPDKPAMPGPRTKDAPRTMKDLRKAHEGKKRPTASRGPIENPLREGLRLERIPDPGVFVLFGATGDLAHRKVIPALYQLWRTNLLPHDFHIMCIGRREYDDESYRAEIRASLEQHSRTKPIEDDTWSALADRIVYHRGDFADPALFDGLSRAPRPDGREQGTRGNRLYYLATQPSAFPEIIAQLGRAGSTTSATRAAGAAWSSRSRSAGTESPRSA